MRTLNFPTLKTYLLLILCCVGAILNGQDLGQLNKVPLLKVNGGVSANAVYYEGTANREPFTYFLTGNLNFNFSGIYNVPLSFSYTNQDFNYSTPFKINRLSIHPSYKWIATHIGDVAMTFSPYTVSGHQFTGFGVDLTPNTPYKISAFYGRLLKATEYNDSIPEALPAYERWGYGLKTSYDFRKVSLGLIFFKASDYSKSLNLPIPDNLGITPKENVVLSLSSTINLIENLTLNVEVAQSAVTENSNDPNEGDSSNVLGFLLNDNESTEYYTALNANFSYSIGNGSVGVGYERIDPLYRTFGAYYFNNDLENITLNAAQELFNGIVSLSFNAGLQRDDLKKQKESQSTRVVGAVNATIRASERLNITTSYSNFQAFTNIKNVFDEINGTNTIENLDTLDFRQVSQNASLQLGYIISQNKQKQQNAGINVSYQTTKDEQGTSAETNNESNFYTLSGNYTLSYPQQALSFSGAFNTAYNTVDTGDALTYGPTLSVSKQFLNKTLRSRLSSAYNESLVDGDSQGSAININFSTTYTYKERHNFNINALTLFRNNAGNQNNDFTLTFGYNYSFDVKKPSFRFRKRGKEAAQKAKPTDTLRRVKEKREKDRTNYYRFRYKQHIYEGNALAVTDQIEALSEKTFFKNEEAFDKERILMQLYTLRQHAKTDIDYKNHALNYLDSIYLRKEFAPVYNSQFKNALNALRNELIRKQDTRKEAYANAKHELETHPLHKLSASEREAADEGDQFDYMKLKTVYKVEGERLESYLFLRFEVEKLGDGIRFTKSNPHIKAIRARTISTAFDSYQKDKDLEKITLYLEGEIIRYFDELYKKSETE